MANIIITLLVQVTVPVYDTEDDTEVEKVVEKVLEKINQSNFLNASVEDITPLKDNKNE